MYVLIIYNVKPHITHLYLLNFFTENLENAFSNTLRLCLEFIFFNVIILYIFSLFINTLSRLTLRPRNTKVKTFIFRENVYRGERLNERT